MIKCQICKGLFKNLSAHLKYIHYITGEEYKKKYNVKHLMCRSLRKLTSKKMNGKKNALGSIRTEKYKKNASLKMKNKKNAKGSKRTKEFKENCRKRALKDDFGFRKGHIPWNKGVPQSEEHKKNQSKAKQGNTNGRGNKQTKENRKKSSKRLKKLHKDGKMMNNGYCKWYKIKNHIGEIEKVQGSFEKRVGEALTKLGIRWKKTKKWFKYKLHGKVKQYNPDFWLKDDRYYIEIKGWVRKEDKEKVREKKRMMIERGKKKGFRYKIMFEKNIKKMEAIINEER